jgi:UDP-2-acetamido-3-amino-2,3-dideoxy-glucuronate N-acetyltransferase
MLNSVFIHSHAICETHDIGHGSKIWAFSHVQNGVKIGVNCNIGEGVFVETGAEIGNNVTIKNGVQIWKGVSLENKVFIGPNVTFTNDRYPISQNSSFRLEYTLVKEGASIGANSTILPGLIIGEFSTVGAGSVVTKNVQANTVVVGNPARVLKNSV